MKAIIQNTHGSPAVLELKDVDQPVPGDGPAGPLGADGQESPKQRRIARRQGSWIARHGRRGPRLPIGNIERRTGQLVRFPVRNSSGIRSSRC